MDHQRLNLAFQHLRHSANFCFRHIFFEKMGQLGFLPGLPGFRNSGALVKFRNSHTALVKCSGPHIPRRAKQSLPWGGGWRGFPLSPTLPTQKTLKGDSFTKPRPHCLPHTTDWPPDLRGSRPGPRLPARVGGAQGGPAAVQRGPGPHRSRPRGLRAGGL